MTPEGAILARPASTVRAGEERQIARRLANLGIPILRTLTGTATFEGADALWLDERSVLLGRGLRTNDQAIRQISETLAEMSVDVIQVDLPIGTMHLMGILQNHRPRSRAGLALPAGLGRGRGAAGTWLSGGFHPRRNGSNPRRGFEFRHIGCAPNFDGRGQSNNPGIFRIRGGQLSHRESKRIAQSCRRHRLPDGHYRAEDLSYC